VADRDYEALSRLIVDPLGMNVGEQMRTAVERYGREVCMPPDEEAFRDAIWTLYVPNGDPPGWEVGIDLWTVEEGRSDLTLQIGLWDSGSTICNVFYEDLHVL
jgi:hypothetical protein